MDPASQQGGNTSEIATVTASETPANVELRPPRALNPNSRRNLQSRERVFSLLCCLSRVQPSAEAVESIRALLTSDLASNKDVGVSRSEGELEPRHSHSQVQNEGVSPLIESAPQTTVSADRVQESCESLSRGWGNEPMETTSLQDFGSNSLGNSSSASCPNSAVSWCSSRRSGGRVASSASSCRRRCARYVLRGEHELAFPPSVHPVEPRDLRRKMPRHHHDRTWRQILGEDQPSDSETQSECGSESQCSAASVTRPPTRLLATIDSETRHERDHVRGEVSGQNTPQLRQQSSPGDAVEADAGSSATGPPANESSSGEEEKRTVRATQDESQPDSSSITPRPSSAGPAEAPRVPLWPPCAGSRHEAQSTATVSSQGLGAHTRPVDSVPKSSTRTANSAKKFSRMGAGAGGLSAELAAYREAARAKYEESKRLAAEAAAAEEADLKQDKAPTGLKSLRRLLQKVEDELQEALGAPAPRESIVASEDSDDLAFQQRDSSGLFIDDESLDSECSSGETSSKGSSAGLSQQDRRLSYGKEELFESDEGLLIRIRNQDPTVAAAVENKRCLMERTEPESHLTASTSGARSSAVVAAFAQVAAELAAALGSVSMAPAPLSVGPGPGSPWARKSIGWAGTGAEDGQLGVGVGSRPEECPQRARTPHRARVGSHQDLLQRRPRSTPSTAMAHPTTTGSGTVTAGSLPLAALGLPRRRSHSAPPEPASGARYADTTPSTREAPSPSANTRSGVTSAERRSSTAAQVKLSSRRSPALPDEFPSPRSPRERPRPARSGGAVGASSPAPTPAPQHPVRAARSVPANAQPRGSLQRRPVQRSIICGITATGRTIMVPATQSTVTATSTPPPLSAIGCAPASVVFPSSMVDSERSATNRGVAAKEVEEIPSRSTSTPAVLQEEKQYVTFTDSGEQRDASPEPCPASVSRDFEKSPTPSEGRHPRDSRPKGRASPGLTTREPSLSQGTPHRIAEGMSTNEGSSTPSRSVTWSGVLTPGGTRLQDSATKRGKSPSSSVQSSSSNARAQDSTQSSTSVARVQGVGEMVLLSERITDLAPTPASALAAFRRASPSSSECLSTDSSAARILAQAIAAGGGMPALPAAPHGGAGGARRKNRVQDQCGVFGTPKRTMSTINISDHDETIYNLVRRPLPPEDKFPKYQSKFHYLVRHEFYKSKRDHKTMGFAEVPVDPPNNYLKRNAYFTLRPKIDKHPEYPTVLGRPDAKPKKRSRTVYEEAKGQQVANPKDDEEKDFCKANVESVVRAVPRQPAPRIVDTRRGAAQPLNSSGLEPKYIFKKEYGKVPAYLCRRLQQEELARQEQERERQNVKPLLRHLSDNERVKLLSGLKHNWQELQTVFQGLPMLTDTIPKIKRKEALEQELRKLERDIAIIERNPIIFVDEGAGDACGQAADILENHN